jgi:hypothetical protein
MMTFSNLAMLFALASIVIPVVIHLLHRRRFDVVEWGAMQFLQLGETTRRRLALEEILLLVLRMGLVAMIVLALAAPVGSGPLFSLAGTRTPRNFVLIIDGSYSMGFDNGKSKTPHQAAKDWALHFVQNLHPGDSVAILRAQEQVIPLIARPTQDLELVEKKIGQLPEPHGGCNLPVAVAEAHRILGAVGPAEIIILSDGQRQGLTDTKTFFQWVKTAALVQSGTNRKPILRLVDFFPADPVSVNYFLAPLKTGRTLTWTGQEVTFKTALGVESPREEPPPRRIRLEIDGQPMPDVPFPKDHLSKGQTQFSFSHRFSKSGSHLVSVILEPDLPIENRPANYRLRDCLPGDNRQDYSLELVDTIPVLLVDGASRLSAESSTFFLKKALALSPDPKRAPVFQTQVVTSQDFDGTVLKVDGKHPRVLILADVPGLTLDQEQSIAQFLREGGAVLVFLGERAANSITWYNEQLHQEGKGWLPARLESVAGDSGKPEQAVIPDVRSFQHPALEMFRAEGAFPFGQARFPRWWKLAPDKSASSVALFSNADPFLAEKEIQDGRVLLCAVPLDRSWGANLPTLWEYPVLVHELTAYLAAARTTDFNLQPGQPIRMPADLISKGKDARSLMLFPPTGDPRPFKSEQRPWFQETKEAGIYRLGTKNNALAYFVAQHDIVESDLTPASTEEKQKLTDLVGLRFQDKDDFPTWSREESDSGQELWWLFLLGVLLLLCGEVWLTRRTSRTS